MKRSPVTPSLYAPDIAAAIRFYTELLGFEKTGSYKDDSGAEIWAEAARGEARIWFFSHALDGRPQPVFSGLIYIFIEDVDGMAAKLSGKVKALWGPETQDYGLREFAIEDLNGYMLVFAKDV
ncbi:MAG: hypothetical protein HC850_10055 [Rhodomicrobium sp.]|nr:hypothetical protein [Rhodomicrobium sp.]